jgi:hypothetical protein
MRLPKSAADEMMESLSSLFAFDYMGCAEFEFGALPRAFALMLSGPLVSNSYLLKSGATVYVIARTEDLKEVVHRVAKWAVKPYNADLKETTRLVSALDPEPKTHVCGWIELDNGFMFFSDREMWEATALAFRVEPA